jgi:ornithine cyclodeaminase/alanine dehydrogenase-like protein (mu-crystallin family)
VNDEASLRYLAEADVQACMPSIDDQLELATEALTALADGTAEMPLKMGVHPRPNSVIAAMPAWSRSRDVLGVKWIATYGNNPAQGLPLIDALIILSDPDTGRPTHLLNGRSITAARTAAVTGVAVRLLGARGARSVAILGAGTQGRSHAALLLALLPEAGARIHDHHPERAEALAGWLRAKGRAAMAAADVPDALRDAEVVVSVTGVAPGSQSMQLEWLRPDALVVAVDADAQAPAALASSASAFLVDDRARFLAYLGDGAFPGYPTPSDTLGEALLARRSRDDLSSGRVLVSPLGFGMADVLFADAVCRGADARGVGSLLPR